MYLNRIPGPNPLRAAQLIHELHLYQSIFFVIPQEAKSAMLLEMQPLNGPLSLSAPSILDALTSFQAPHPLAPHPLLLSLIADDNATKARLYLASLCLPYLGFSYQDAKKKTHLVVTSVIRDSLKFGVQNHYLNGIPTLFSSLPLLKAAMNEHKTTRLDRIKLGLLLRNKLVHNPITGNHWTTSLLFSLVTDLVPHYDTSDDKFNSEFEKYPLVLGTNGLIKWTLHLRLWLRIMLSSTQSPILSYRTRWTLSRYSTYAFGLLTLKNLVTN